jgi:hypothetical protein
LRSIDDEEIERLAPYDEWRLGYLFGLADRACPLWADDDFRDGWRDGAAEREYRADHARQHRNRLARQRRAKPRPYLPRRPEVSAAGSAAPCLRKRATVSAIN